MTIRIDPDVILNAVDINDLKLDLPDDPALQQAVNEYFPSVLSAWVRTGSTDPYEALVLDGVADEVGPCIPPGITVGSARGSDIRSATCHTIRQAIERVYGVDPCTCEAAYTF